MKNCTSCIYGDTKKGICQKHTIRHGLGDILKPYVISNTKACSAYNADFKHCAQCGKELSTVPQWYEFDEGKQINFCGSDCKNKKLQIQNLQEIDKKIDELMWGECFQENKSVKKYDVLETNTGEK